MTTTRLIYIFYVTETLSPNASFIFAAVVFIGYKR